MRTRKTIRQKLLLAMVVLAAVIAALGYGGFRGVYAYRDLTIIVSERAAEFPLTSELTREIDDLRYSFQRLRDHEVAGSTLAALRYPRPLDRQRFRSEIQRVREVLSRYHMRLENSVHTDPLLSDRSHEIEMVREMKRKLASIVLSFDRSEWNSESLADAFQYDLDELSSLAQKLPTFLQDRMASFRDEVRTRYRAWIALAWMSTAIVLFLLIGLCAYIRLAVVSPFKTLLLGSRRVAAGDFEHRIEIDSQDELSELANAINTGTESFLKIRRDLNDEVRERTREVIRNEQLASVGFLAAGVAHEINNPLASIAWSAEALESRLHRILHPMADSKNATESSPDLETLKTYLRRIQDEAFRCKGITERLLDFSRMGQSQKRQIIPLRSIVEDVVDMVRHLGQYRNRAIEFQTTSEVHAMACPQEIKQVVLNLLTNALDSLAEEQVNGFVRISISEDRDYARLIVEDNGCGLSDEVRQHLFEPFFTRRRDGRGTGLGLSITSRIIADHGGRVLVHSDGVGRGSRFEVLIPTHELEVNDERSYETRQYQAA